MAGERFSQVSVRGIEDATGQNFASAHPKLLQDIVCHALSAICSLICFIHTLWVLWLLSLVLFLRVCHNFNTLVAHTLQREVANARTQLNHWLRYVALWVEVGSVLHGFDLNDGASVPISPKSTLSPLSTSLLRNLGCEAYYCFHFRTCERCSMGYFFTECTVRHSFALRWASHKHLLSLHLSKGHFLFFENIT